MYNRLILVAGSGRSGTSLFAGILKALGCHVPQPEVAADETNPKGFGEPRWVVNLHSKLLRQAGVHTSDARPSAWAQTAAVGRDQQVQAQLESWLRSEFGKGDHVVIKDPRLSWFIPAWRHAGETVAAPCFVSVLRHPLEVIESKQSRYGQRWSPNARTAGWINMMLYTERATRGDRRGLVRYEDLLEDAMAAVSRISEELDLVFIERPNPAQMRVAASLVDPSLKRTRSTWASLEVDHRLVELAEDVAGVLDEAAVKSALDDNTIKTRMDALRQRYLDLYRFVETTAQFSIAAGEPVNDKPQLGAASNRSKLSPQAMRKIARRAKKKGLKSLHQLREKTAAARGGK